MRLTDNARLERTGENSYAAQTDPAYWNLIGPFGGWIAAVLLRCVLDDPRHIGEPLSLSLDFAGPMEPGAFAVRLRELRHNRSTTFWSAEIVQEQAGAQALCAFATIVTARRRETPSFLDIAFPVAAPPEGLKSFAGPVASLPFLERLDLRYATNPLAPPSGGAERLLWAKARDQEGLDFETLTALCDSGLPPIFARLKKRVPVSSVTLNVFYYGASDDLQRAGDDFVLSAACMRAAASGFFDTAGAIWTRSGTLLATTEQIVWFAIPR